MLIVGTFVGGISGYLGSVMVLKRMALVGDALGHIALPGMGLALLLGLDVSLGAFAFLLVSVFLIWLLEIKTSLPTEALVGVTFVASLALGFLLVPEPELLHSLIGDISNVGFSGAIVSVFLAVIVFAVIRSIRNDLILSGISPDVARAQGISIKTQNLIYLISIAAITAVGIKITGTLLVGALVIIPAAASKNISRNLKEYSFLSVLFGVLSSVLGIIVFKAYALPVGPMLVLVSVIIFIFSLVFKNFRKAV
ncbi:MAG: metal ABC transporter permease [bacterium]|nr:metal ABC transporter permease [bacterium]